MEGIAQRNVPRCLVSETNLLPMLQGVAKGNSKEKFLFSLKIINCLCYIQSDSNIFGSVIVSFYCCSDLQVSFQVLSVNLNL